MSPSFTINDVQERILADAKLMRQSERVNAWHRGSSYFKNLGLCQFCAAMSCPLRNSLSSFLVSIMAVIGHCSKPQVVRIAARGIVAGMKDVQSVGDWPLGKLVSNTGGAVMMILNTELAVSGFTAAGCPRPTFVGFADFHFRPEAINLVQGQVRDDKMFRSHDFLLSRKSWSERRAETDSASRSSFNIQKKAA